MKDYFVLTFSQDCPLDEVHEAAQALKRNFPNKDIIVLPELMNLKEYTKDELLDLLNFYIHEYMIGAINEQNL